MGKMRTTSSVFCLIIAMIVFSESVEAGPRLFKLKRDDLHSRITKTRYCFGPETSLLAENSLDGWTTISGKTPPAAWSVVDGTLHLNGKGGDIVTDREFKNYVLDFEWTIAKGGNSGIKYRFKKFEGWGWLGPEFQVLDDYNTSEGKKPKNCTATLYDILPTKDGKPLNPHEEINRGRIVVKNNRLEHWLNGKKMVDVVVGSEQWKEAIAKSKFNNIEGFGENRLGRIMIQDHGCMVWFHKISIREIFDSKNAAKGRRTTETRDNAIEKKEIAVHSLCETKCREKTSRCKQRCYKAVRPKPICRPYRYVRCCK